MTVTRTRFSDNKNFLKFKSSIYPEKIHPYFGELTEMLLETVLLKCKLNGMIYEKCIMDQIAVVWFSRLTIWEKWQAN